MTFWNLYGTKFQLTYLPVVCCIKRFVPSKFTVSGRGEAEYFNLEGFEFSQLEHDVNEIMAYDLIWRILRSTDR